MNEKAEILGIFRSHFLMIFGKWVIISLILVIIFFFVFLFLPRDPLSVTSFAVTMLLIASGMFVTSFTHWWLNTDIITRDRLLCVRLHGLFHYSVEAIPIRKVQSVDFRQEGFIQNIFGFGNIYISSELLKGESYHIILRNIGHHEKLVELLRAQSDTYSH